ncbi:type II CRISPR RNA-guided endonuclease Cas9 [Lachnospiraceae bacterium C1.1]|nr:type II CRISPR RNA-guided endonuclease Cas9 [Lachnospiraceae bacterium C1.1]
MKEYGKKYYVGLDMGTSSVGWAVTDENYELRRAKGKDLWGARLFDEAKTSAERRVYRSGRRRLQREKARIGLLKEYFADEINKKDPGFYLRLEESKFHLDDRDDDNKQKYALFTGEYTDKDYYLDYPTIFHLRKALIDDDAKAHDVRMVFLALLNMFKHRGNFLNSSLDSDEDSGNLAEAWETFVSEAEMYDIQFKEVNVVELEKILSDKGYSKTLKEEKICQLLEIDKKQKAEHELISLLCGKTGKLVNIYGEDVVDEEHKKLSVCFRDSNDEKILEAQELLGDQYFSLIEAAKTVHDIGYLANILRGHKYLTYARVEAYENHKADLELLKKLIKKYEPDEYNNMFRVMGKENYSAYVGSVYSHGNRIRRNGGGGKKTDELYKMIKNILEKMPNDDEDVQKILNKIEADIFLPKQMTFANGVIPNQVYVKEMKKILLNAEAYLPFLRETDDSGLTVSQRILALFSFRIPYYVGPIGQEYADKEGYNVWSVRREAGRVYPWNFEQKIDTKLTAEKFIGRMVGHCSYLNDEKALPKCSLQYERFMVLNELNNIKVNGEEIAVEIKQDIYNSLFKSGKKISIRQLENYFKKKGFVEKDASDFIGGIDTENGFKSSLSTYGKFHGVIGDVIETDDGKTMVENIVFWMTVYGDDRKYVKERIKEKYNSELSDAQIKRILGFRFSDWGNLSKEFLNMSGTDVSDERSVLTALWETNKNLMELLSGDFSYKNALEIRINDAEKSLNEWSAEDLEGMYLSAPVRRMVWQTIRIMREITEVTGHAPDRIFVEMPREDGEKGKRTKSRKQKLSELYGALKAEGKEWKNEIEKRDESEFRRKKLYLYYLQMGKCMYTGETIDLEKLLKDNSSYDIDHIYPRHYIKDDSIENNLVLVKKEKNAHKSDVYPIEADIRNKQIRFWKLLVDKGFISRSKYERLTRVSAFTDEEKAAFISRQLVETRQGTKAITKILQDAFPDTTIVFSKAGEVSDFRKKYDMLKVRCLNDLHHAKDAYLNIVVGNTYFVKFTSNPIRFIKAAAKNPNDSLYKYNMDKIFEYDVIRGDEKAWIGTGKETKNSNNEKREFARHSVTLQTVKRTMAKNSVLITKRQYVVTGGITGKDTIYSAKIASGKEGAYIVASSDPRLRDVSKYGGRTAISTMCYCLVTYMLKKKRIISIEALPVYLGDINKISDDKIYDYLTGALIAENKGKEVTDIRLLYKPIRFNEFVRVDGHYYYIGGRTGSSICLENGQSLLFSKNYEDYLKIIEKASITGNYNIHNDQNEQLITKEKNLEIYSFIVKKLEGPYKNKKTSIMEILKSKKNDFKILKIEEQIKLILNIIEWMNLNCIAVDLSLIGSGSKSGYCRMNKKINDCNDVILISQSITGLYEKRINLLEL